MKRRREITDDGQPIKRQLLESTDVADQFSRLSHELTLRILSHLDVPELIKCHRVSRQFKRLSTDSQLWKAHYYERFVRPRVAKLPGTRGSKENNKHLAFSSKLSKWLDEDGLLRRGGDINWKRQYKLRHNWSRGTCSVSEVPISEQVSVPPLLVQMKNSTVFTADRQDGLRAWSNAGGREMLAEIKWDTIRDHDLTSPPTCLAIDSSDKHCNTTMIAVAFQDGSFNIFSLSQVESHISHRYRHAPSSNGMLTATALCYPHMATMTANQLLSIYKFDETSTIIRTFLSPPTLLHSLHSRSVSPPLTLTIRPSPSSILISIAYSLPTYLSGWTIGLQELSLDTHSSQISSSRLASATPSQHSSWQASLSPPSLFSSADKTPHNPPPSSISYSHPYVLVSHADNTLTMYLVSSTRDALRVSPATLLFGHASRVSGTSIGSRGRAVSVAARGGEVRVWDLEERARGGARWGSVKIVPAARGDRKVEAREKSKNVGRGCAAEWVAGLRRGYGDEEEDDVGFARGWVGFDEENVVALRERDGRGQSLVVYDFAS